VSAAVQIASPAQQTAEQLLADARRAFRDKARAEGTLARLRTYRHHTPGMKSDADRALRLLRESNETLDRVLGGAA
jgi:hypothetical protein